MLSASIRANWWRAAKMPSTNGHSPKRVILYARVSTDEQARSGFSLAQQLEALRDYAAREGYEVIDEVQDAGQSGASLERPGMDRVRDLVSAGGVSVVLAQDRDRFAREPAYHFLLRQEFAEHGTKIRALNDLGDDSPEGDLTDGILDQIGKFERAKIAERTRRGKLRRAREGKIVPTSTPDYGFRYTSDREGYEVDPEQMDVVRRIFKMVGREGMKLHGAKKSLDGEGVPTPGRARYWNTNFIRSVVRDDVYKPHTYDELRAMVDAGQMTRDVFGRLVPAKRYGIWWYNVRRKQTRQVAEVGPDGSRVYVRRSQVSVKPRSEWIAVPVPDSGIPRDLVDAARDTIKNNQRSASRKHRFWELAGGITRCGGCGRVMYANTITNRNNLHYFRCPTRRDNGKEACEVTHRRADVIEAEVWESVRAVLSDPDRLRADLDAMIELKRQASRNDPTDEINHWLKVLADADEKRAKYQRAYAADVMTLADLKARLAELEQECQIAERELASLRLREREIADLERDRDALLESYAGASEEALDSLMPKQRHNLYKSLRIEVLAHADGSTEIVLGNLLSYEEVCTTETTSAIAIETDSASSTSSATSWPVSTGSCSQGPT
jgi:site-specific DNA recombinase